MELATQTKTLSRKEVELRAEQLLATFGMTAPAVDAVAVAEELGIEVYVSSFVDPDVHGSIVAENGIITIRIKRDDPPNRQNFTLAHEIGHARLHLLKDGVVTDGYGYLDTTDTIRTLYRKADNVAGDHDEIQANQFAAALLMPEAWVRESFKSMKTALELSRLFRVSEEAMSFRMKTLNIG